MATQDPRQAGTEGAAAMPAAAVVLQCVAATAGTLIGHSLGSTLTSQLIGGVLGTLVGAFLTAPGGKRHRRIVAVSLLVAFLQLLRAAGARASDRKPEPLAWVPANWAAVGVASVVGLAGGSAITTARDAWAGGDSGVVVAVPDVLRRSQTEALAILDDAGLDASTATEPSSAIDSGFATRTSPPAGTSVEQQAAVTLFVSSGPPQVRVAIPDVTGMPRREAAALLADNGLHSTPASESSDSIAAGSAIRTEPRAATVVDRGETVVLVVSSGPPSEPVRVPDVRDLPRAEALALLRRAGLHVRTRTEPSEAIAAGRASYTEPAAGEEAGRGDTVTLVVSTGPAVEPVEVPPVAGLSQEQALQILKDKGLTPSVEAESSETVARGTVTRTDPAPGTVVDQGSAVTAFVSSGPAASPTPEVG
jgi:serine/threonine-protein kinase